jgi:hypothetical protein
MVLKLGSTTKNRTHQVMKSILDFTDERDRGKVEEM